MPHSDPELLALAEADPAADVTLTPTEAHVYLAATLDHAAGSRPSRWRKQVVAAAAVLLGVGIGVPGVAHAGWFLALTGDDVNPGTFEPVTNHDPENQVVELTSPDYPEFVASQWPDYVPLPEGYDKVAFATAVAQTVETLTDQSARLRRLIADLEVVSRAQERQLLLSTRPIPVAQLIDTAVAAIRDRYRAAEVTLTRSVVTGTPDLIVDPDRIGEVLTSLLDNALRHTPAGGAVTIRATASANPRGPGAIIELSDTGTGFRPEEADKIFQRFHKGPTSTGSGLGLTIARAIVDAHHGTLTATSDGPDQGAKFTITIPAPARPYLS